MVVTHLVTNEPASPYGYECGDVGSAGSAASGEGKGDFWNRHSINSDGVEVIAGSYDTILVHRNYDKEFLSAHRMDRFVIQAPNGSKWATMVWGGDRCAKCPEVSYEALPGDVSRCGTASDAGSTPPETDGGSVNLGSAEWH